VTVLAHSLARRALAASALSACMLAQAGGPAASTLAPASAASARTGPASLAAPTGFAQRADVLGFVRQMSKQHGFAEEPLIGLFSQVRASEPVLRHIAPAQPGFRRSWPTYRARFIEPTRLREGTRFWRDNAGTLRRATERFGVPEEIIVSIIGIETLYGRHTGEFRVIDALTTLAFDYPRRSDFFRDELEQFLLLSREQRIDPLVPRGSFAGAIGLPQFMPGSIRRYAIDFDGDGTIDLSNSAADAIGSVARFLQGHGWQPGGATHFPVRIEDEARARPAIEAGIPPSLTTPQLVALGVTSPVQIPADEKLALVDLPNGDDTTTHVLGTNNFYVITRYNRSYFYAMAVIEFAAALKEQQARRGR
jgi:membrane-bound lytic murein transglycosylase B